MAYPFNLRDWYWIVGDNNPATEVFSSDRQIFVLQASDTTYLNWVAAGNAAVTVATKVELYKLQQANPAFGTHIRCYQVVNKNVVTELEAGDTIEFGVVLVEGDLVGLAGQTDPKQNGIWRVQPTGQAKRALDVIGSWYDLTSEHQFFVQEGGQGNQFVQFSNPGAGGPLAIGAFNITGSASITGQSKASVNFTGGAMTSVVIGLAGGGSIYDTASSQGTSTQVLHGGTTPVWGSIATADIAANAVDNTKAADMAQSTFKMRAAGAGTGDPIDGTAAQAKTALAYAATELTDYSEGTWTPVLAGLTTPGTQTYSVQSGRYVRIGRLCFVTMKIQLSAKDGTTSGAMVVTGLPFTSANISGMQQALSIASFGSWDLNAGGGYTQMLARVLPNDTKIELNEGGDNVGLAALTDVDFGAASSLTLAGCYYTT